MASKLDERRCFIDYLPSLLLLWGLLFFQPEAAAQDLELQIGAGNSPCISSEGTDFQLIVTNIGENYNYISIFGYSNPIIIELELPNGATVEGRAEVNGIVDFELRQNLPSGSSALVTFTLTGITFGNLSGNVRIVERWGLDQEPDENKGNNRSQPVTVLSTFAGDLGNSRSICRNSAPGMIGVENESLAIPEAEVSFEWYKKSASDTGWKLISGVNSATFSPGDIEENSSFKRRIKVEHGGLVCSAETEIFVEAKICQVASNPMMRMQALKPQEDGEE